MNKQKKISYKNISNIFEMMKDRELCFDGGLKKPPLKQSSEFQTTTRINKMFCHAKARDMCFDEQIKQMTKAQMIKYLRAYKANYELLSFVLHPKFRPPPHVLPVIEPQKAKPKTHSCFSKVPSDQSDSSHHRVNQLSHPSTSFTTLSLGRKSVFHSKAKGRPTPYPFKYSYSLKTASNCTSLPRRMNPHGNSQRSDNSRDKLRGHKRTLHYFQDEHDQEIFYDVESSSCSY